jgi:hypothetical protein
MTCVKPFTIPDKWVENNSPPWTINSTFDRYDNKGKVIPNADVYIPPSANHKTGPTPTRGRRSSCARAVGGNIEPTFYYSWKMPGDTGGDFYRDNIAGCNTAVIPMNSPMVQEPGNMIGPPFRAFRC